MENRRFTIICPCCEATLQVDAQTGAIISHEEKAKGAFSFDNRMQEMEKEKELRNQLFQQELSSHKDRDRILEEKFKEAMKRADVDKDKPFKNPLELD